MINLFNNVKNSFNNHTVPILNTKLKSVVEKYAILYFTDKISFDENIYERMNESEVISIRQHKNSKELYLIICFEQTIIIINPTYISNLKNLFSSNPNLTICFQEDTKSVFDDNIKIEYTETKLNFNNIILDKYITPFNSIIKSIVSSILQYLLKKSFIKLTSINRIKEFHFNNNKTETYNEDDYIIFDRVDVGTFFQTRLIYMIESEKILVIKEEYLDNKSEIVKLFNREKNNYQKFNHPLLPKYYGANDKENSIIIEYINGENLNNSIKNHKLNENDKIRVIFEILIMIRYFHDNEIILRDLKPNNINRNDEFDA